MNPTSLPPALLLLIALSPVGCGQAIDIAEMSCEGFVPFECL